MKQTENQIFGPDHAVINLSKIGLRYFRIGFKVSSKEKVSLTNKLSTHPNVGWIFEARGWFNLAAGFWARDNAEINNISDNIRSLIQGRARIIFQSELTALYGFGNRPAGFESRAMTMIDPHVSAQNLTPLEIDYIKIVALSSEYSESEIASILSIQKDESKNLKKSLEERGIISGTQRRMNYGSTYYKLFIDTGSVKKGINVDKLLEEIWIDKKVIFFCKTNDKYNFEIEIITDNKKDVQKYATHFGDTKVVILTKNIYTNLYPINKVANVKEIQDTFINQKNSPVVNLSNSKIWYLNYKSAQAYLDIYENKEYYEVMEKDELELFPYIAKEIIKKFPDSLFEIVDIGAGNGLKAKYFIENLGAERVKTYYPVDIQPVELEAAKLVHKSSAYETREIVLDFEKFDTKFPLKSIPGVKRIYLFFGGTYGNFQSSIIISYLKSTDDVLLISMPTVIEGKTKTEIEDSYSNETLEIMGFSLLTQAGFEKKDFRLNPKYPKLTVHANIEDDNRNIISFYLKNDVSLLGNVYKKDTRFTIMSSWKPTLSEFNTALESDFVVDKMYHNKNMAIAKIIR